MRFAWLATIVAMATVVAAADYTPLNNLLARAQPTTGCTCAGYSINWNNGPYYVSALRYDGKTDNSENPNGLRSSHSWR